jgi:hypothetical protein
VDDPGGETREPDRIGAREAGLAHGDVNLLLDRGDPRYRREEEPGASAGPVDDHAVPRRVELIGTVDGLSSVEEIHGHVEFVDFTRLQRGKAGVRDRRSNRRAGNLAPHRWLARPNRADAATERAFHRAGCRGPVERDEDAARRRVTRHRWRFSDFSGREVVADRGPGHTNVRIFLSRHLANVDASGHLVKGRKSMDGTARAA